MYSCVRGRVGTLVSDFIHIGLLSVLLDVGLILSV